MASFDRLRDHLPSLYRPEPDDGTLLTQVLRAVANRLDELGHEAASVLQAHWAHHADRAALDPSFTLRRTRAGLPALDPLDVLDVADPARLLRMLRDRRTPLTAHMAGALSPATSALVASFDARQPPPVTEVRTLFDDLNAIARGEVLWDGARFDGIDVDPETIARAEADPGGSERTAVNVRLLLAAFPGVLAPAVLDLDHARDLGRLGALLPLPPWREPIALAESAEAYRQRLRRMVALYRRGLGTVASLRALVEATLPVDMLASAERRDRPFAIEEFPLLPSVIRPAPTSGAPANVLGPLMRWTVDDDGVAPGEIALVIEGVAPEPGRIDATIDPMVELYAGHGVIAPVAIGVRATLGAAEAVALRPAWTVWAVTADGVVRSEHSSGAGGGADPSGPGVEASAGGTPPDVEALHRVHDGVVLAIADGGEDGRTVFRFDGTAWTRFDGAPAAVRCLAQRGQDLLFGTASGLFRAPTHPATGDPVEPTLVAGSDGVAVRTIHMAPDGGAWIGADDGLLRWDGEAPLQRVAIGGEAGIETAVHGVHVDRGGVVHLGTDLGAIQWRQSRDAWSWFANVDGVDPAPEWRALDDAPPRAGDAALPKVRCVRRGPDAALWFGSDAGIARYAALAADRHVHRMVLEAYPDLGTGRVHAIHEDGRGGLWFCTDDGLFRFDGRDWWQRRGVDWTHLGRRDLIAGAEPRPRGTWRFDHGRVRWRHFDVRTRRWLDPDDVSPRAPGAPATRALLFAPSVTAERGRIGAAGFEPIAAATPELFVRVKPDPTRIVDGGAPFVPPLPPGRSTWRYLQHEPDGFEPPSDRRPYWSVEGRLFPPPPDRDAPFTGRFDRRGPAGEEGDRSNAPQPEGHFDQAVFRYPPAARITLAASQRRSATLLVRLVRRPDDAPYEAIVVDRVWDAVRRSRPVGVRTVLAADEAIVRGVD